MTDAPSALRAPQPLSLATVEQFAETYCGVRLRGYQTAVAQAIIESVMTGAGLSFAVMMSRQAGKNEVSALVEAHLLYLRYRTGGQIIKASPTYRPQTINSKLRLVERLPGLIQAELREGYMVQLGKARCLFMSASPTANVVGATASLLLECDEAQSVDPVKWWRDFAPMAASTNATTVFWGTAWTDQTLLAQVVRQLRQQEAQDGIRRVFIYDADVVAQEVPAYGRYVTEQVARLGREHPLIKSQYYLEEIKNEGGLFHAGRQAQMRGDHARERRPMLGVTYAFLVDVGGAGTTSTMDDGPQTASGGRPTTHDVKSSIVHGPSHREAAHSSIVHDGRRDATALTIVAIDPPMAAPSYTGSSPASIINHQSSILGLPTYRVVDRRLWLGVAHTTLYAQLLDLARLWETRQVVVDATGLGSGLAQFLQLSLGPQVIPVILNSATKTKLGWRFLGLIDTGRFKDYVDDNAPETRQFWYEVGACEFEATPLGGLRWGVWETPRYDGLVARGHDDLLLSAALCCYLDDAQTWRHLPSAVSEAVDVLDAVDSGGF